MTKTKKKILTILEYSVSREYYSIQYLIKYSILLFDSECSLLLVSFQDSVVWNHFHKYSLTSSDLFEQLVNARCAVSNIIKVYFSISLTLVYAQ